MTFTGFPRSMAAPAALQPINPARPAIGDEWSVLGQWTAERPSSQQWNVAIELDATVDGTVAGELRIRIGQLGFSNTAVVDQHLERLILGFTPVSEADWIDGRIVFVLEGRRGAGTAGGVRVLRAEASLMSVAPLPWRDGPLYPAGYTPPYTPAPPPVNSGARIPTAQLNIDIDADDLATWGRDRLLGQWVVAGNRFNVGSAADNIGPTLPVGDQAGYNLAWNAAGDTIESFAMEDGTTERLQRGNANGLDVIESAVQFVDDGSYVYQAGINNTSLNVPPSDPLFFDGTRAQISLLEQFLSVGVGCDAIVWGTSFVVEPWMFADDFSTAIMSLHAPVGANLTSPILGSLRNGSFFINSKDSDAPVNNTGPNPTNDQELAAMPLPAVGDFFTVIVEFCIDPGGVNYPGGGGGYMNCWQLDGTGLTLVSSVAGGGFGYTIIGNDPGDGVPWNDKFYMNVMVQYHFHRFTPGASNNWDLAGAGGSNVRRLKTRFFALHQGALVSVADMADHARFFLNN